MTEGIPGHGSEPQQGIPPELSQGTGSGRPLNVFFDVDNTLIMWNGKLRNHTRDVFQSLKDAGHTIYVWSGVGIRRWDMKRHDLDGFVTDYFVKPLDDHHARLVTLGVPMTPDFVIDDHKTVVDAFGGYHIPDMAAPDDDHLLRVLDAINEMATLGDVEEPGENVAV
ncbi:MAG: HAD hydrolase family protein [Chloroflexi bacterium]|nr:HAD hydrolase family protein [Chloroflexota bacterium]MDA1241211.1 HAD hydrolase family protein [Chloroflexota bacterium]